MMTDSDFPCGRVFSLPGAVGTLEALAGCPSEARAREATAIVCHPHPLFGGTMSNKVVHTLARTCERLGARSLRFNFRGVGASEGSFADGRGETEDLLAVLAWARARFPQGELWLAGFSFGAYVALRAARQFAVTRLVTVAPAVHLYRDLDGYEAPAIPWLLVQGSADEVVAPAEVMAWVETLPRKPEVALLEGVGHFFHQRLPDLARVVSDHLAPEEP